jgi:hypothetical protein
MLWSQPAILYLDHLNAPFLDAEPAGYLLTPMAGITIYSYFKFIAVHDHGGTVFCLSRKYPSPIAAVLDLRTGSYQDSALCFPDFQSKAWLRAEPSLVELKPHFAAPLPELIQITSSSKPLLDTNPQPKTSSAITGSDADRRAARGARLTGGYLLIELIVIFEQFVITHHLMILPEKLFAPPGAGNEKEQPGKNQKNLGHVGHGISPKDGPRHGAGNSRCSSVLSKLSIKPAEGVKKDKSQNARALAEAGYARTLDKEQQAGSRAIRRQFQLSRSKCGPSRSVWEVPSGKRNQVTAISDSINKKEAPFRSCFHYLSFMLKVAVRLRTA